MGLYTYPHQTEYLKYDKMKICHSRCAVDGVDVCYIMKENRETKEVFSGSEALSVIKVFFSTLFLFIIIIMVIVFVYGGAIEKQIEYYFSEKVILKNGNKVISEYNYKNEKSKEHIYSKNDIKIKEIFFDDSFISKAVYFDKNEKPKYSVTFSKNTLFITEEKFYLDNENPKIVLDYSWYYITTRKPVLDKEVTYYKSGTPKTIVEFNVNSKRSEWKYTRCFNDNRKEVKCQLSVHGCTNRRRSCTNKKELDKVRNEAQKQ